MASKMKFPVLGRWRNEAEFRDYLADHLAEIELDLTLVETEHSLSNRAGSGGKVDILATDALGNYVCIEVKRSDNSARATLNELSKYITLFCKENDVQKERVRCLVVSTHWHEVLLPLSVFAETCGTDVSGYKATIENGTLILRRQELKRITFSSQISPECSIMYFRDKSARKKYLSRVEERAAQLPFVRIALLFLNPIPNSIFVDHVAIAYIWKIPSELYSEIERVTGNKLGRLEPYAHPTAKAEIDAGYWIFEEGDNISTYYSGAERFGTPEKVVNLLRRFTFSEIKKVGRWPAKDLINTNEKLLAQMTSFSPIQGGAKQNRYKYSARTKPQLKAAFDREVNDFLEFLSFSEVFRSAAETFLKSLELKNVEVVLSANRGSNAFMDLYLSSRRGHSQLASFTIKANFDDKHAESLIGGYFWDGQTVPHNVEGNMIATFGSVMGALMPAFSSAEWPEETDSMELHGLIPVVFKATGKSCTLISRGGRIESQVLSFNDFVFFNKDYFYELAKVIESVSDLGGRDVLG
ncbi:endonuclease NucS domain-containing protein [Pseudooceanicola sp.]|uniref:endonuclease NucS domain-containing protein n=1 Tax=Pseudooceanicola sp. TaxID=1914328 RepID=UPI003518D426